MKPNSVKTELWRLLLLPALSITLLLAGTLTYLYSSELSARAHEHGRIISDRASRLAAIALRDNQPALLEEILDSLHEEPSVRALHLYDQVNDRHYHSGPRFSGQAPEEQSQLPGLRQSPGQADTIRFREPVVNADAQALGWVEVEMATSLFSITLYKTLLIAVLATTACLLLASFLAVRLHHRIIGPVHHLIEFTRQLTRGQFSSRADTEFPFELSQLSSALNAMAMSLEQSQTDMQSNITQSMDDLRETLETIEIQNIELDMARKEALAASRIKSEFLANTSHEIRTPLNGIIGFTKLALKTSLDQQQRNYLQTIQDSATNLLKIINDILDFSKIESGKLVLDYLPLPVRKTLEEAVESLAYNAQEKNLQVITLVDPNIPPQLMGDPQRLKQVVANLLDNAIKFSPRGTVTLYADLMEFEENHVTVKFTVEDEGPGLSKELQTQLFNSFTQADTSTSRQHSGTGLGLAICKGLVQQMHGNIGVESQPEQGSSFWFTTRFGIDNEYTPLDRAHLQDRRILVCSEEHRNYRQLQNIMTPWQAKTTWVASIHELFPTMRKEGSSGCQYDLLILDVSPQERKLPPGLLGNLATQLESEFQCKMLVWCTPPHRQIFEQHNTEQPIHFINKPITQGALWESIAELLQLHSHDGSHTDKTAQPQEKQILVVDDNPANLKLATEILKALNIQVCAASGGQMAIDYFAQQSFDAVFMDIQMPGMDGMETTKRLRLAEKGKNRRTPIIALTAHSLTEQKTELLLAGFDDCLRKPLDETHLRHVLKRWVHTAGINLSSQPPEKSQVAEPGSEDFSPVNLAQCLSLAHQKPDLARDMLMMLIAALPEDREKMLQAHANSELDDLQEHVHRLYGSSCYCGVPELRSIAGLLDKILQSGQREYIGDTLDSLLNAIDRVLAWSSRHDVPALFPDATTPAPPMQVS